MKTNYLLSNKFKVPGFILLALGLSLGVYTVYLGYQLDIFTVKVLTIYNEESFLPNTSGFFKIIDNNILDEIALLAIILGGLFIGFSKEKVEDEFISKLRTDSLIWAIIVNYIILMFATTFVYNFSFFNVLVYNMFTPLLFFIIRFNFLKARS